LDIETEGLEPWADRIICIGVRDIDSPRTKVFFNEDEESLLKSFISYCKRKHFQEVIGYNICFDMRFLFAKCLKYEIPAAHLFDTHYIDLMDNVRSVKRMYSYNKPGKLDDWLQFLFGVGKLEKGESVIDLFEKREITRIIDYCKQDVDMTFRLWERVRMILCK